MPRRYLVNAFSLSMLPVSGESVRYALELRRLAVSEFCSHLQSGFESAIGHQGTAELLTALCGVAVPVRRAEVRLERGDELLVVQLLTRLPEGRVLAADELARLVESGQVNFLRVRVE